MTVELDTRTAESLQDVAQQLKGLAALTKAYRAYIEDGYTLSEEEEAAADAYIAEAQGQLSDRLTAISARIL